MTVDPHALPRAVSREEIAENERARTLATSFMNIAANCRGKSEIQAALAQYLHRELRAAERDAELRAHEKLRSATECYLAALHERSARSVAQHLRDAAAEMRAKWSVTDESGRHS